MKKWCKKYYLCVNIYNGVKNRKKLKNNGQKKDRWVQKIWIILKWKEGKPRGWERRRRDGGEARRGGRRCWNRYLATSPTFPASGHAHSVRPKNDFLRVRNDILLFTSIWWLMREINIILLNIMKILIISIYKAMRATKHNTPILQLPHQRHISFPLSTSILPKPLPKSRGHEPQVPKYPN